MTRNLKIFTYPAYGLAFALVLSAPVLAQPAPKVLAENAKATVSENSLAPGANANIGAQQGQFLTRYYLSSGTLEYTYADGRKETVTRKAGTAIIILPTDKRPAAVKNIGTTALRFITVNAK